MYPGIPLEGDEPLPRGEGVSRSQQEQSQVLLDKGLFPIFMELKNYKPLFLYVSRQIILKSILKKYVDYIPNFDEKILNEIQLYCGKRLLDINAEIQYLNLNS